MKVSVFLLLGWGFLICKKKWAWSSSLFVSLTSSSYQSLVRSLRSLLGASLLLLWPHLLPFPLTFSILAILTTLLFFQHGRHVPSSGLLNTVYPCLKHGFLWFLVSSQMSSSWVVSPEHPVYNIVYPMPLIALSSSQPCFIYLFFHGTCCSLSCHMFICLFICVYLFPHLPFVFPFVEIGDSEPTGLACRRYSLNIVEWTNKNVDNSYLLVDLAVGNETIPFNSNIYWERKDSKYGFSI